MTSQKWREKYPTKKWRETNFPCPILKIIFQKIGYENFISHHNLNSIKIYDMSDLSMGGDFEAVITYMSNT